MEKNEKVTYNDSTQLRPDGDRILNAPLVRLDLKESANSIRKEALWKEKDRNAVTVYKSDGVRMVVIAMHKHAIMEKHTANGEICVQVLEGEIRFRTEEQSVELKEGQAVTLHRRIPHEVEAVTECVFLLTLHTSVLPDNLK